MKHQQGEMLRVTTQISIHKRARLSVEVSRVVMVDTEQLHPVT